MTPAAADCHHPAGWRDGRSGGDAHAQYFRGAALLDRARERDDAVHAESLVRGRGGGTIAPSRPAALSIKMHLNEVAPEGDQRRHAGRSITDAYCVRAGEAPARAPRCVRERTRANVAYATWSRSSAFDKLPRRPVRASVLCRAVIDGERIQHERAQASLPHR